MKESGDSPGPDPSSLEAVDYVPDDIVPITFRVTYTSHLISDYISLDKSGRQFTLELADPLLSLVRKAGKIDNLKDELVKALGAIGLGGIAFHFNATVAAYVNSWLPVHAFPETIALSTTVYLLKKAYETGLLRLGQIHQASVDELPNWMEFIEEAKRNPDIHVT